MEKHRSTYDTWLGFIWFRWFHLGHPFLRNLTSNWGLDLRLGESSTLTWSSLVLLIFQDLTFEDIKEPIFLGTLASTLLCSRCPGTARRSENGNRRPAKRTSTQSMHGVNTACTYVCVLIYVYHYLYIRSSMCVYIHTILHTWLRYI